jgi:hypothetical protein
MTTATVLAIGLAAAAGLGAPAAQAETVKAGAADGGFILCGPLTGLPNEPNSKANACLSNTAGTLNSWGRVDFASPQPSGWTGCLMNVGLYSVASDNTETLIASGTQQNCQTAAQTSSSVSASVAIPFQPGTYRTKTAVFSQYLGQASWSDVAWSPVVIVW